MMAIADRTWRTADGSAAKRSRRGGSIRHRPPTIRHRRGLSLIEMLISLAITAMLLTATVVALDASFHAYAAAAESASTQTSTRLVTHRLLKLVRTSTAHGPLEAESAKTEGGVSYPAVTIDGDTVESYYLELIDDENRLIRIEHRDASDELWVTITDLESGSVQTQPLMGGVTAASFHCHRRREPTGVYVLRRASIDLTVQPDDDASLDIERGAGDVMRIVASTKPRQLD